MYAQLIKDATPIKAIDHTILTKNNNRYKRGVTVPKTIYLCNREMSIEPFSSGKKSVNTQYNSYNTNIHT